MADSASQDEISLLIAAEARIDTAMAHLILVRQGVVDAKVLQIAIAELQEARTAITLLRDRFRQTNP